MSHTKGVEIKGSMYTFMSLKLHTADIATINAALADKVQQAPAFFKDTPVVIDLAVLEENEESIDGKALIDCIRSHALQPIVASVSNKTSPLARSIAIPLVDGGASRSNASREVGVDAGKPAENAKPATDTGASKPELVSMASREIEYVVKSPTLINKPVRRVIADNNIHIYGPLRGRALCGVSGNTQTRIFCQSLEAELVSVAGNYRMLETIPEELRGKPAQIWLDNDRLHMEPL
ncbi:MAG: septum site-determining protein MinC [Gammaproteobacteria bacterium]|nr:MAG: septum site-determining protein MinC [Gammaproteobacteria bacterium]